MTIQTNIPVAPRFAQAVNAETNATPLSRVLSFFGGILGFNLGVRVREAFTRPTGMSIREYCASTVAFVEVKALPPIGPGVPLTYDVKVIETCRVPGQPKARDLMVIGEAVTERELEVTKDRAEAVAIGYNAAYQEVQALTIADLVTVDNMIEQAIGAELASLRAAQAQEAISAQPSPATN